MIEIIVAGELSEKVKKSLMGYEPDVFTAMYKMRDNIPETLEEGILAVDENGIIQFANEAAIHMLCDDTNMSIVGQNIDFLGDAVLSHTIKNGDKESNINLSKADIILDRISIKEENRVVGAIAVLHNRAEYANLMEDFRYETGGRPCMRYKIL